MIAYRSEKPNNRVMTVDWIRAALEETGKTRSGLARALGRSPSAVTDLLNGRRRLRADEIAIAAAYLGVEPPRLIGGGRAPPIRATRAAGRPCRRRRGRAFLRRRPGPVRRSRRARRGERQDGGGADPRPFARRAVRQLARLLRRRARAAGRRPRRPHVRVRPRRRAGADQGAEAQPDRRACGRCCPTPSRRSTTSRSTGRRWCAKCGRDRPLHADAAFRARHRARARRLSLGDARRRRRPALCAAPARRGRLRRRDRRVRRSRNADDRQPLGALRRATRRTSSSPATPTSCRRATRRAGASTRSRRRSPTARCGAAAPPT